MDIDKEVQDDWLREQEHKRDALYCKFMVITPFAVLVPLFISWLLD